MKKRTIRRCMALCMNAALLISMSSGALAFQDVPSDSSYAAAISNLEEQGVAVGVGNDLFRPNAPVTQGELAAFLARMSGTQITAGWPEGYVNWAVEQGLMETGVDPSKAMTSDEVNKILTAFCKAQGIGVSAVTSEDVYMTRGEVAAALNLLLEKTKTETESSRDTVRQTAYGSVKGYWDAEKTAYVWKSIPYGKADRWSAPTAPEAWTGTLDCTKAGEMAIQLSSDEIVGVEDCLKLDIYAPENAENLPVLFFIHGGNNQTGSADAELKGETLANKANCVFVSVDFRLGALGFNPLPALNTGNPLEDSGNYALLDIAYALDWVSENIAAFGGNGSNITISGFSAGGRDVMATLISPLFEGKYKQAISFSGGMTTSNQADSIKVFAQKFAALAVEDQKKDTEKAAYDWLQTDGADVREWLMGLSAGRVAGLFGNAGIRMALFPHLYMDGTVLPKEGFDTTKYADVPVMMVSGTGEFSLFGGFSTQGAERDWTLKYGDQLYELSNIEASAVKMNSKGYQSPMYSLTIDFGRDTEENSIPGIGLMGGFHGIFVNLIDQYSQNYSWVGDLYKTPAGMTLSDALCAYIGNFIRTGNPNGDSTPVNWTSWAATGENTLMFGNNTETADIQMTERRIDYNQVIAEIETDKTLSAERKEYLLQHELNGRWFSGQLDEHFNTPSLWISE